MKKLGMLAFSTMLMMGLMMGMNSYADLVDDFSRNPEVRGAKISPTGEYLAIIKEEDDKNVVAVFDFPEMKLINVVDFPGRSEVGNYWWVNDERLLFRVDVDWGNREEDVSYGELYAVNADGKKGKYLFGMRGDQLGKTKSRLNQVTTARASASFVDPIWRDPKKVLVSLTDWNRGYKSTISTAVLDVYSGRLSDRLLAPTSNAEVFADPDGNPRFSFYRDDDNNNIIYLRDPDTGKWREFSRAAYGESQISPSDIHTDGRLIVRKAIDDGPEGVYLMDPETQKTELVYQNDLVDAGRIHRDWASKMYAVESTPGKVEQFIFDPEHPEAQLLAGMKQAFPDANPVVASSTHDFRLSVVVLEQDTRTLEFYIYNRDKGELRPLFDAMPWIDDNLLSAMEPIEVTARDGLQLHGYLTVPKGAEAKNLPLVIVPHGGPHGPRDLWGFQWFEGFVPAAGYAMLQINYRGSGGYGMAFERKGFREWGKKMQDDLTDATLWAIEEGIADPDRICIFGWSYGGYATLMGIVREPDLYQCAVAGAGVYDQDEQYKNADFTDLTRWGKKFMDKVIGPTAADRIAASPTTYVDVIKTPLLLVHGEDDARVPIEHAYHLQKAMKAAGKPVPELIELANEGHTPRREENNLLWRRRTVDFFEQHIGPGVKPKANQQVGR